MNRSDGVLLRSETLLSLREFVARVPYESESHPSFSGGISGKRRGTGHDFYDLRPFEQGDDIRKIDASASARSGKRQVRQFHEEVDQTAILIVDFRSPMLWATRGRLRSIAAAEVLVILGWGHIDRHAKLGLFVLMDEDVHYIPPAPRESQMLKIIAQLEALHLHASGSIGQTSQIMPLDQGLEHASGALRRGCVVEMATGFDQNGTRIASVLERMSQRYHLRILQILDHVQLDPPRGVYPYFHGQTVDRGKFADKFVSPVNPSLPLDYFTINSSAEPEKWASELSHDS